MDNEKKSTPHSYTKNNMNKEISIDGKKLSYSVYGNGKPVVLLHGFGEDATVWNQQVDFLKDRFYLIVPELPGMGGSAIIDDMSMEGMAETIKQLLDAEGLGKVDMIGHSMGGYITLAFAEKYPALLTGFGLFHSSAYPDSEEKKEARRKGIAFIEEHGAAAFLETATPNLFSPVTKDKQPELIDKQLVGLSNFSPHTLVLYYQAMIRRPDRVAVLKNARVPVLFLLGKYDMAVPFQDQLQQCHLPENSYIHILALSGHMGMLEETVKSNRALEDFLSR
jgi:pimeloyl-ACP methyl ester carboxylesterase